MSNRITNNGNNDKCHFIVTYLLFGASSIIYTKMFIMDSLCFSITLLSLLFAVLNGTSPFYSLNKHILWMSLLIMLKLIKKKVYF